MQKKATQKHPAASQNPGHPDSDKYEAYGVEIPACAGMTDG
jgi:hypothetical protein